MSRNLTVVGLAKEIKEGIEWLWKNKCGCCRWWFLTDDKRRRWSIVIGWSDGFDDDMKNDDWLDGTYAICSKIGYEEWNNVMQTDMDWDFLMPYDEETGEVDDTCSPIARNVNYMRLAEELMDEFKRVTDTWAYFEDEEEEIA